MLILEIQSELNLIFTMFSKKDLTLNFDLLCLK